MSSSPDASRLGMRAAARAVAGAAGLAAALGLTAWSAQAQAQTRASASTPVRASPYAGLGRPATPQEIAAWDIDVRPDFKGLPRGSGSVARGMEVWESKCASCHGVFGESNVVFSPIVGGTTTDDIKTGRVARLNDSSYPGRTTLMKLSHLSALWDYINRAMPWTAPKSLSTEEVYGVTAYILHLGGILPADFTLSDQNIAQVQALLPNRHGKTTEHALWPDAASARRKPDVMAIACMSHCATEPRLASSLPDFARNAHGNLALQNRTIGAQRGADTGRPPPAALGVPAASTGALAAAAVPVPVAGSAAESGSASAQVQAQAQALALARQHTCTTCHGVDHKIVGPSFREISKKHAGRADATAYLAAKMQSGGTGVWGTIPMPPQTLGETDAKVIAQWLADGAAGDR